MRNSTLMKTHDDSSVTRVDLAQTPYWTRNDSILANPSVNIRFAELLMMNEEEVTTWIDHMRREILTVWDSRGIPPLVGNTEDQIVREFRELSKASASDVEQSDEDGGRILADKRHLGHAANQFFPSMLKARIRDGGEQSAYSVYDLFADRRFRRRMQNGCRRHFRHDSFYLYSPSVRANAGTIRASTGVVWIKSFARATARLSEYSFWLSTGEGQDEGSGYTRVDRKKLLSVSRDEVLGLLRERLLPVDALVNVCSGIMKIYVSAQHSLGPDAESRIADEYAPELPDGKYYIRLYKNSTRIFPVGFAAFKIGYSQVAGNFPSIIAKYLYERYTDHCKDESTLNIYDPSAGWGGRVAGAMAVRGDRQIHYIGTDPNPDNYLPDLGIARYEYMADFINGSIHNESCNPHTVEIFRLGSEVIGTNPRFRQYAGQLDLVFTSPPYFCREIYSENPEQSAIKFPSVLKMARRLLAAHIGDGIFILTAQSLSVVEHCRRLYWAAHVSAGSRFTGDSTEAWCGVRWH